MKNKKHKKIGKIELWFFCLEQRSNEPQHKKKIKRQKPQCGLFQQLKKRKSTKQKKKAPFGYVIAFNKSIYLVQNARLPQKMQHRCQKRHKNTPPCLVCKGEFFYCSFFSNKSGRNFSVNSFACSSRQASMFLWCPEMSTSGTFTP